MSFSGSIVVFSCAPELRAVALIITATLRVLPVTMPVTIDENDATESLPKALAAAGKIKAFNSEVEVLPFANDLTPANLELLKGAELVLDGTDNFETRFLINDYCVSRGIPWIYSAAVA